MAASADPETRPVASKVPWPKVAREAIPTVARPLGRSLAATGDRSTPMSRAPDSLAAHKPRTPAPHAQVDQELVGGEVQSSVSDRSWAQERKLMCRNASESRPSNVFPRSGARSGFDPTLE